MMTPGTQQWNSGSRPTAGTCRSTRGEARLSMASGRRDRSPRASPSLSVPDPSRADGRKEVARSKSGHLVNLSYPYDLPPHPSRLLVDGDAPVHPISPSRPCPHLYVSASAQNKPRSEWAPLKAGPSRPSSPPKTRRGGTKRRHKYSRTKTGCRCCRARRIKCTEERPVCRRCVIAKRPCSYADAEEDAVTTKRETGCRRGDRGNDSRSTSYVTSEEDVKASRRVRPPARTGMSSQHLFGDTLLPDPADDGIVTTNDFRLGFTDGAHHDAKETREVSDQLEITNHIVEEVRQGDPRDSPGAAGQALGLQKYGTADGAPLLSTPNFLLPWFPTQEERNLILHYCANAADLQMAIPSGINPMLAINLPLALDSPRGINPSADALRVALLGIGAIHQAFLLARSGVSTSQTAAMFQYATLLRDTGKEMVRKAAQSGCGTTSDAALGAGTSLATIDIFFGGGGWRDNFQVVKKMIASRGGPAAMLKSSKPTLVSEGTSMSPARMMLEILAIYETFGCLTTNEEPSLISETGEDWWFGKALSTYEEQSVEKQFGMSRIMVHLFARLVRLMSRVSSMPDFLKFAHTNAALLTPIPALESSHLPAVEISSPNASSAPDSLSSKTLDPLASEAIQLHTDVNAWIESMQSSTLEHERVQVGNRAYAHAMKILLLRRVFASPREDYRVQSAALEVLKHCSTSTAILGMSIDLTWPAIVAGCCLPLSSRPWLWTLLEGFKSQCCFDIETASKIVLEAWRRVDEGSQRADWKEVCDDLGLTVLLC